MNLRSKLRVVRQFELAGSVRLQAVAAPNSLHRTDADAGLLRHRRRSPLCDPAGSGTLGQSDNAAGDLRVQRRDTRWTGLIAQQTIHALRHKPLLPPPDRSFGDAGLAHDRGRVLPGDFALADGGVVDDGA